MTSNTTDTRGVIGDPSVAPSRIWAIVKLLSSRDRGLEISELEKALMPSAHLSENALRNVLHLNLKEAREAGLIQEIQDSIVLSESLYSAVNDADYPPHIILTNALLSDTSQRNEALFFGIAWLLEQDPYADPSLLSHGPTVSSMANDQVDKLTRVTSDATFSTFFSWANWLGFSHQSPLSGSVRSLIPDPTNQIRPRISSIMGNSRDIPIATFMTTLSQSTPVFEGGKFRIEIASDKHEGHLSKSTSLALLRLEREGLIELDQRSDATVFVIQDGKGTSRVSHISLKE